MTKPRDNSGNDFIFACGCVAEQLFRARFKRESNQKSASDLSAVRKLAEGLYSVIMQQWKLWELEESD